MSKTLKKILTVSSALLMIASVGAATNNTNVNAKHRHYRTHRVYRHHRAKRHYRRHSRSHENGADWYFHNAYKLKRRYLNKNSNFTQGWIDADTINGRPMRYDSMTDRSSNCYPQMTGTKAGHGRYGEGWITSAYYKWNDSRGRNMNSHRSNRINNLRYIIRNYNDGINYLQSGGERNSQNGNIYMGKHGNWFADQKDNY